jgi:hypothetical protein
MIFFLTLVLSITQLGTTSTDNVPKVNACLSDELYDRPFTVGTDCFMIPKIKLVGHPKTGLIVTEKWKSVPNFENEFEISNYGRLKSIQRQIIRSNGRKQTFNERLRKFARLKANGGFYYIVNLTNQKHKQMFQIHRLVAMVFVPNPKKLPQVNHKNRIKTYNIFFNLEWVSDRENISHSIDKTKTSSKYTGVCWIQRLKKWRAYIYSKNKCTELGYFKNELSASRAYKKALIEFCVQNKYAS